MATQYLYSLTSSWGAATSNITKKAIQLNVQGASAASYLSKLIEIQTSESDNSNLQTQFGVYRDGHVIIGSETTNKFISGKLNNLLQGTGNTTSGSYNLIVGFYNSCDGNLSVVEGANNKLYSNAVRGGNYNAGFSHIEGRTNIVSASYAHMEGFENIITQPGYGAHVEGRLNIAYASGSHAEGYSTRAVGLYSHVAGNSTIASGSYQNVVGQFNTKGNTTSYFVVGTGPDNNNRTDGFSVAPNIVAITGSIKVKGAFITASTNVIASAGAITTYIPVVVNGTRYKMPLYAW